MLKSPITITGEWEFIVTFTSSTVGCEYIFPQKKLLDVNTYFLKAECGVF
jgi:hypothetical protein